MTGYDAYKLDTPPRFEDGPEATDCERCGGTGEGPAPLHRCPDCYGRGFAAVDSDDDEG